MNQFWEKLLSNGWTSEHWWNYRTYQVKPVGANKKNLLISMEFLQSTNAAAALYKMMKLDK